MSGNKVTEIVSSLVKPIVEGLGCELVDVEYVREGSSWCLRVLVDKTGGITLNDCEAVHRPLGKKLDELDPIPNAYTLEVSSPGLERPFKTSSDFEKAIGQKVMIRFFQSVDGSKTVEGILEGYDGKSVTLLTGNDIRKTYSLKMISKINRMIIF